MQQIITLAAYLSNSQVISFRTNKEINILSILRDLIRLFLCSVTGTMEVDGIKFNGMSRGSFETLDLQLPLYVGGHPDYSFIQLVADINVGFQGIVMYS